MAKARVTFSDVNVTLSVPVGHRIVVLSEPVGAGIPFGCKENDGGDCLVEVLEGGENLSVPSALEAGLLRKNPPAPASAWPARPWCRGM